MTPSGLAVADEDLALEFSHLLAQLGDLEVLLILLQVESPLLGIVGSKGYRIAPLRTRQALGEVAASDVDEPRIVLPAGRGILDVDHHGLLRIRLQDLGLDVLGVLPNDAVVDPSDVSPVGSHDPDDLLAGSGPTSIRRTTGRVLLHVADPLVVETGDGTPGHLLGIDPLAIQVHEVRALEDGVGDALQLGKLVERPLADESVMVHASLLCVVLVAVDVVEEIPGNRELVTVTGC